MFLLLQVQSNLRADCFLSAKRFFSCTNVPGEIEFREFFALIGAGLPEKELILSAVLD